MPMTHRRTFDVRHGECDLRGRVHLAHCLRYMQETAFDASAAAGYDLTRYDALGCFWLVRETDLELLRPLRYGDTVQVKTWVADFRLVRSRRAYELRLATSGELAARAHTDWVFMDRASLQPAIIPRDMMAVFFPEGLPEQAPPRPRFPAAPPPPPGVFSQRRQVEWRDVDTAQHANNAVYIDYLEECGRQALAACGWPAARLAAAGLAFAAQQLQIEYLLPALLDDELALTTWLSAAGPEDAIRHHRVTRPRDGALLAQARAHLVWQDIETGQPVRAPAALLADLSPQVAAG